MVVGSDEAHSLGGVAPGVFTIHWMDPSGFVCGGADPIGFSADPIELNADPIGFSADPFGSSADPAESDRTKENQNEGKGWHGGAWDPEMQGSGDASPL